MTGLDSHANPEPVPHEHVDLWNFRTDVAVEVQHANLGGYRVEAIDGGVGTVDIAHLEPTECYLVVRTGRIMGKRTLVPAGVVNHVDREARTIYVDRSRSQIKGAPVVPPEGYDQPVHREALAGYYQSTYRTNA